MYFERKFPTHTIYRKKQPMVTKNLFSVENKKSIFCFVFGMN